MTADAQMSDGLHYLSEVNLAKVAQILYLVEKWPLPETRRRRRIHNSTYSTGDGGKDDETRARQFKNKRGEDITLPEGVPLPPLDFFRQHDVNFVSKEDEENVCD